MRALVCLCIFAGILLAWNPQAFWENRFSILPLQSTRADVERLYGISSDSCRCNFQTPTEAINVAFATAPCALPVYGWNVPKDTVLSFRVTPRVSPRFSEMASDLNGFVKRYSPEDIATTYYTNVNKGIVFAVQDGHVISIRYFPANKENAKRCPGFPPYDGVPPPRPFDTIFNPNKSEVEARLGNLAIELSKNNRYRGYIVAYAGKISRRGEAKRMAEEARSYLIEWGKISPDRIIAIDGGYRDTAQYDLFMLGLEIPAPMPTPTVPSNEVQIVRAGKAEINVAPKDDIDVPAVKFRELTGDDLSETDSSGAIRNRVINAASDNCAVSKATKSSRMMRTHCQIDSASERMLESAMTRLGLLARAYDRILKVSRTIADLKGSDAINSTHVSEAVGYRSLDGPAPRKLAN